MVMTENRTFTMAEHDLTQTIIPYLDRHLAFPLLTHLAETTLFPEEQIIKAQYELTNGTNMVDYSVNLFEQLNPDAEVPTGACHAGVIQRTFHLRLAGRVCRKA